MRFKFRFVALFAISILFSSCNYGWYIFLFGEESVENRADSIQNLNEDNFKKLLPDFSSFSKQYSFLVITDPHIGSQLYDTKKDEFFKVFTKMFDNSDSTKIPRFVLCLGDNGDGGRESEYRELNEMFEKMEEVAKSKGVKEFKNLSVLGNHDLYNDGWENFKKQEEPFKTLGENDALSSAYKFSDGVFSYYVFDSASGTFGETQRALAKSEIENDKNPKIILTHVPIYAGGNFLMTMQDTRERNVLLTLFEKNNVKQVFCGHAHKEYGYNYGDWREDVFDAFGAHRRCYLVSVDKNSKSVKWQRFEF